MIEHGYRDRLQQIRSGVIGEGFADIAHLHMRGRQTVCQEPPVLTLDHGLFARPSGATSRVVIITCAWTLRMSPCPEERENGEVDGSTVAVGQILAKARARDRRASALSHAESNLELTRNAGILSTHRPLLLRSRVLTDPAPVCLDIGGRTITK